MKKSYRVVGALFGVPKGSTIQADADSVTKSGLLGGTLVEISDVASAAPAPAPAPVTPETPTDNAPKEPATPTPDAPPAPPVKGGPPMPGKAAVTPVAEGKK